VRIEEIAADVGFAEGPVFASDGSIWFVAISDGALCRVDGGKLEILRGVGGGPNGLAEGLGGDMFVAQSGSAAPKSIVRGAPPDRTPGVEVVRRDGEVVRSFEGMTSPNDLAFGPDGLLYVTDPTRVPARDDGRLWRMDTSSGEIEQLAAVGWYPNGLAFTTEVDALYVADTKGARVMRFPLDSSGLGAPEVVIEMSHGIPDGLAVDAADNIIVAAVGNESQLGQVQTWSTSGELLHVFDSGLGRFATNVALSLDRRLVITDSTNHRVLCVHDWPVAGIELHPFR
jgi:gluconolactonase